MMFSRFDWRSDDENDWNDGFADKPLNIARPGKKPISKFLFLLIAFLLLVGIAVFGFLNRRVTTANDRIAADVLAAHNLIKQAIDTGDVDLFDTLVSTQYENWHRQQVELFRHQLIIDRRSMGMIAPAEDVMPGSDYPARVKISPDLASAEIIEFQPYLSQIDSPEPVPIILEMSSYYERHGERWVKAPRDPDAYWGDWLMDEFGPIRVTYPARDKEAVGRLGVEIAELVNRICERVEIDCPAEFTLRLLFAREPGSLMRLNDNYRTIGLSSGYAAYRIILPAPTLVGRPITESGYQALFRGYGSWIAAILVNRYGLERGVDVHESMAAILKQWELTPPPMPKPPTPQVVRDQLPPIPYPEQEILMTCHGHTPVQSFVYDPKTDDWHMIGDVEDAPAIAKILSGLSPSTRFPPDSQGFLIRSPQKIFGFSAWQAYLWLEGMGNMLVEDRSSQILLADPVQIPSDPANEFLVFYQFGNENETLLNRPLLLNVDQCFDGNCELIEIEGIPIWSPNHNHTLVSAIDKNSQPMIYLGDEVGNQLSPVGYGYGPIWLDGDRFAYIRPASTGGSEFEGIRDTELVVVDMDESADSGKETILLKASSLKAAIPGDRQPTNLMINMALNHPQRPNQWFLTATSTNGSNYSSESVFMFDSDRGSTLRLTSIIGKRFSDGLILTENGRFLSLLAFDEADLPGGEWELHVIDLQSGGGVIPDKTYQTDTGYYQWSRDGEWLLLAEDGLFRLIAPGVNYERQIQHNLGCHLVGWMDSTRS